jgi:hypothetical protein
MRMSSLSTPRWNNGLFQPIVQAYSYNICVTNKNGSSGMPGDGLFGRPLVMAAVESPSGYPVFSPRLFADPRV